MRSPTHPQVQGKLRRRQNPHEDNLVLFT